MRVFIDDIRVPQGEFDRIARSAYEFRKIVSEHGCPKFISFDHDLGTENSETGHDIAKWIVEQDLNSDGGFIPDDFEFDVHSANPVGAENIRGTLDSYLRFKYGQN